MSRLSRKEKKMLTRILAAAALLVLLELLQEQLELQLVQERQQELQLGLTLRAELTELQPFPGQS